MGDHVRAIVVAASHPRGRLGEDRPAGLRGEAGGGLGDLLGEGPQTITPRGSAAIREATSWTSSECGALACSRSSVQGRPSSRPRQSVGSSSSRTGASGSRSGKFRCTGPGPAAGGGPVGTARERAVVDGGVAARVVGAHLHEPLGGVP